MTVPSARLLPLIAGSLLAVAPLAAHAQEGERSPAAAVAAAAARAAGAPADKDKPDFPQWKDVSEGFEKVTTAGEEGSLFTIYKREKDQQLLAELPRGFANQRHMFTLSMPRGELFAGLQMGEIYGYWKRFDKRIAFIAPQLAVRSTGDTESKDAIQQHFTDRVVFDLPIVCIGPAGQPVIDLDGLLTGKLDVFYGGLGRGANPALATVKELKSFPENFVAAFEIPTANGVMRTFHYNVSLIPDNTGYKPREADNRVGYFYDFYRDLGKFKQDEVWTRYINRWHLEKADPKLRLSPAKKPIVFYVEHTVPVRYRRYVREGLLAWNKAFEKVGISDAIEVYYQDKATNAHMEKDPEDARYNFVRWLANDIGTAIGPSRTHPLTGQILDADIILTDGWIRHFWYQANEFLPQAAMEGMSPETVAWLDTRPQYDPRVRLAPPEQRQQILDQRLARRASGRLGIAAYGGSPLSAMNPTIADRPEFASLFENLPPHAKNKAIFCLAAEGKARDMAIAGVALEVMGMLDQAEDDKAADAKKDDDKKDDAKADPKADKKTAKKDDGDRIDDIPEWFVGPMLADLVMHECGHTLGLRHNFRASSIYSLKDINSKEWKDNKKPIAGSVMDYNPVNINMESGEVQGPYTNYQVGPYDMWAIEWGYTMEDPSKVIKRVAEPELTYATDEDTIGPDPLARRYDQAADPRDYAQARLRLAKYLRDRILDKFVKEGESWARARRGYQITLSTHVDAVTIMANWVGGTFVNRDKKGDPGNRAPLTPVSAEQQRAALKFVVENAFFDDAFGLTPDLLSRMTVDKWWDGGGNADAESTWPIHDRISGVQSAVLTRLMNPTTLRRVYDNEFLKPDQTDALTLPELLNTVSAAIWQELDKPESGKFTNRDPMISSLRRSLQREHLERLIDLSLDGGSGSAGKPVQQLAALKLRELGDKIKTISDKNKNLDDYTKAHLAESGTRIAKALDATYTINASAGAGGFPFFFFSGETAAPIAKPVPGTGE